MQEMEHCDWDTCEEKKEEDLGEVGYWTNSLSALLTLSWMVTLFFFAFAGISSPSLNIDVGAQIAPYLGLSGFLTLIWLMNKIYSSLIERRTVNPRQRRGHL